MHFGLKTQPFVLCVFPFLVGIMSECPDIWVDLIKEVEFGCGLEDAQAIAQVMVEESKCPVPANLKGLTIHQATTLSHYDIFTIRTKAFLSRIFLHLNKTGPAAPTPTSAPVTLNLITRHTDKGQYESIMGPMSDDTTITMALDYRVDSIRIQELLEDYYMDGVHSGMVPYVEVWTYCPSR